MPGAPGSNTRVTTAPRRRWRLLRRAAIALVVLVLGLLLALHLPPVQRMLVGTALDALRTRQALEISYSNIRFNLFTRYVRLDGLRVGGRNAPVPLVAAERVEVRFPFTAFRGKLDGLDVTLTDATVNLIRDDGRFVSVPAAWTKPRDPGAPPRRLPAFQAIRLHDMDVVYEDRDARFRAETSNLTVDLLQAPSGEPGDLAGELQPGATTIVRWEPRGTTLELVKGRARFSPDGAGADGLVLDAPEGRVSTDVAFAFRGADRFHLDARARVNASQLSGWVEALETADGTLDVDFTMPSTAGAPAFADVAVRSPLVEWRNLEFRDVAASGSLETGAVALTRARLAIGPGRVEGTARLAWKTPGDSRAALSGRDLDLNAILRTLVPDSPAVARYVPASLVSGRFEGRWREWKAPSLAGVADMTWRSRPGRRRPPESLRVDGRVVTRFQQGPWPVDMDVRVNDAIDVEGRWSTRSSAAAFSDWPIDGVLSVAGQTAEATLAGLAVFDTDAPVDLAHATGDVAGTVTLSGSLGEPVSAAELSGAIAWPDQPQIDFRARTVVNVHAVAVQSFEAKSGPSSARGTLEIDLDRDTMDGQFTASAVPVESWLRRFAIDVPVTGTIDATGRVSGPRRSYVLEADVEGGPVLAMGQRFDRISGHVRYDGAAVEAERVHAVRGEGTVDGALRWARTTSEIDGTFQVAAIPFETRVPGVVAEGDESLGRLTLQVSGVVRLGGTAEALAIESTLSADDVRFDAHSFGPVNVRTTPSGGSEMRVELEAPQLGAMANGTVDLSGTTPFNMTLRVDTPDSPLAASTRGLTLDIGAMTLEVHAEGTLRDEPRVALDVAVQRLAGRIVQSMPVRAAPPEELAPGDVTVSVRQETAEVPVLLAFSVAPGARVTYRPEGLAVSGLSLTAGETRVSADGALGRPGGELTLAMDGRLEDLRALALRFAPDWLSRAELRGPVHLNARASGSLDKPAISGTLNVDGAIAGDGRHPPLQDIWLRVALDGEEIRLDLAEARWQGAHLALSGSIPTWFARLPGSSRTDARASLTGHVDEVTLKVLEPFVEAEALQATSFDSRLEFTLTADEPAVRGITADVVLAQAVLRSRDLGLAQRNPGRLHLERGVLTLQPWTIGAPWSTATAVTLAGSIGLPLEGEAGTIDASVEGPIDLRAIGLLLGTYRPAGKAVLDARIRGALTAPALDGSVAIEDGELLIRDPRLVLADVNGTVRFEGDRLVVQRFDGSLNGGSVEMTGSIRQPGRGQPDGAIAIGLRGVLLEIPRGLRSSIDADLSFSERPDGRFALQGTVDVVQASYRETLLVTGGILSLISPSADAVIVPDAGPQRPTWLVLDVRVVANDSIAVDTPYGRFYVGANVRVAGTPANPRFTGAVDIAPGGELFFGGRRYQIESGRVEFRGASYLRPDIRLQARTTIGGYDVTFNFESRGGVTEVTLTSDPPLPEEEIASLMLSGQRRATGDPGDLVTEQLFAALSGEIVGTVGRAIGFDSVRLEQGNPADLLFDASLISSDSNPAQRLTFSKRVFPDIEVIVSQSLRESGDLTWIVSWTPLETLELRFVQLDDRDRSYEVRHDISFGGGAPRAARSRRRAEVVRSLTVEVRGNVTEEAVRDRLDTKERRRFDFHTWQRDRDRLEEWLFEQGYYEATVRTRREPSSPPDSPGDEPTPVDVRFEVATGPRTAIVIDGIDVPGDVRQALARAWADVRSDDLLEDAFADTLLPWLASQGYLQADVELTINLVGGVKTATIHVTPGPRTTERIVEFTGNEGLSSDRLLEAIRNAGLQDAIWVRPAVLQPLLLGLYRRNGFLTAEVDVLPPVFEGATARLPVRIEEGPRFRAGTVRVEGVGEVPGVDTSPPIWENAILTDRSVAEAVRSLESRFRRAGYRGTRVTAEATTRPDGATVDLVFNVLLGQRLRLEGIQVAGNSNASDQLVERTFGLEPGDPISWDELGRARDRLYDTGLFRTVSVELQPIQAPDGRDSGRAVARITLEELPRYRLRYGFQLFDPVSALVDPKWGEVDPGVVADLTRRGLFDRGLTAGAGMRLNASERTLRGYLSSRTFLGAPLQTNFYVSEEREKTVSAGNVLDSRTRGVTFDQRFRWRQLVHLGYGYTYERRVFDLLLDMPPLPLPVPVRATANIGRLLGSLVLDDRDNVVDTRQGGFHSSSVELAPESLGSTLAFKKYLTQNFYFVPWKRVTFGTAARLELSGGPGRALITSERLRVGGSNTVRGYEDDTLQLQNVTGRREGTTTVLVLNQEVRFPLVGRLTGGGFWDYARISGDLGGFTGLTVRNGVGMGVRLLLPFILLRADFGYPLNQDERNDTGRWYFAIGHAF